MKQTYSYHHIFLQTVMLAVVLTSATSTLTDDYKLCQEWFPDRNSFLVDVNSTSDAMSFTTADSSMTLKYFISFEIFAFLGDNVITMIPWILLISITLLGWLCCGTFHLVGIIRKEKLILSPSEKKKFLEAKKAEAEANPEAEKEKSKDESGEEEEDEDDDVEDLVEEDIRPSNNPDFKEREFKISFLAQLVLFLGMTGIAIYIAVSLSSFSKTYMRNSCRYTELAYVFKFGTTNQQNFTFGGIQTFWDKAKSAKSAMEQTNFESSTFTDLQTSLNTYLTSYTSLKTVYDQVYFSPSNSQFTTVRDPLDGNSDTISYLKTWGNLSEEAISTGLWNQANQEFSKGPRKANFVYTSLGQYLSPFISQFSKDKSSVAWYSQLSTYITQMELLNTALDTLYLQVSNSFISGLKSAFNANIIMILMIAYGGIGLCVLLSFFCEVMFFRKRDKKIYRSLTNTFWCIFAPGTVAFASCLSVLAPLTAAGTEYYAMLEPTLLNRTFYGKLEYPSDKVKAGLFPCTHGDGKFHTSGLIYGNPIIQFTDFTDFLNTTMTITSNIDAINTKFASVSSKMNSFESFSEDFYVPPSTTNQNRKISVMLKVLNAYTNKNSPYRFNERDITQELNCASGDWTYDVWVADEASCDPFLAQGYSKFNGATPAAPAKTCLWFSGKTWATDSSVINRYPTTCSDTFSSPNVYRNAASNYMGLIKNHHTDISAITNSIKGYLTSMMTGGPTTLSSLDTQMKSVATKATAANTSLSPVLSALSFGATSISKSDNCSFIKYSLLNINAALPEQQDSFQTIILLGLGMTSALMFINLANCMMGQFRITDDKFYKEWDEMKKTDAVKSQATDSQKPVDTQMSKEQPKLVSSVVVNSNLESKVNLPPAPNSAQPTDRMSSILTEEKEKAPKMLAAKRDSVSMKPAAVNKIAPAPQTLAGPRMIKPSSMAYGANFFAPKPAAKVKIIKAAEVEKALDNLRAEPPKTNKINEVDDADVERIRNAGLFGEISRPLRPLR